MTLFSRWKSRAASSNKPLSRGAKARKVLQEWVISFAVAIAVLAPIRSSIADWNDVPTGSMEPTILPGDRITVNKLAYGLRVPFTTSWLATWDEPAPGEIVVLFSPKDGTRLVKRLIEAAHRRPRRCRGAAREPPAHQRR
jgi:signal peptidase I